MPRFYIEAELAVDTQIELTETVFHHWCKVLRAQVGDQATLFNGQGGEYHVELTEVAKKSATVQVLTFNPANRTPAIRTLLGQVMSKGDRMDYAIQKAVELGVSDHWQGIAIAACEQCGMNIVPKILAPLSLEKWFVSELPETKLVLAPNKDETNPLSNVTSNIALLIGPEGGLSEIEIQTANEVGFISWCIGERVLRTETAPVVALSILNYNVRP